MNYTYFKDIRLIIFVLQLFILIVMDLLNKFMLFIIVCYVTKAFWTSLTCRKRCCTYGTTPDRLGGYFPAFTITKSPLFPHLPLIYPDLRKYQTRLRLRLHGPNWAAIYVLFSCRSLLIVVGGCTNNPPRSVAKPHCCGSYLQLNMGHWFRTANKHLRHRLYYPVTKS